MFGPGFLDRELKVTAVFLLIAGAIGSYIGPPTPQELQKRSKTTVTAAATRLSYPNPKRTSFPILLLQEDAKVRTYLVSGPKDAWNRELAIVELPERVIVISRGADNTFGTEDDVAATCMRRTSKAESVTVTCCCGTAWRQRIPDDAESTVVATLSR